MEEARARYIILKQPLNPRTATGGEVPLSESMSTVDDLVNSLLWERKITGNPRYYVVHGQHVGRVGNWQERLVPGEFYTICPDVQGIEIPLWAIITGLVLGAASVGYSIYSYMDMRGMVGDMMSQDPTRDDGAGSQSYSYATKENYRTDNLPIPIVYGKTKLGGVVVNELQYGPESGESESYKAQIVLAEGPIVGIAGSSDIFLNDSMISEYTNYTYSVSSGVAAPTASSHFSALYQQHFPMNDMTNTLCLYFPFNSSSTNLAVTHESKSGMREIGSPNTDTPSYSAASNSSISTSVIVAGYSSASLRINSTSAAYLRYADDFENFFRPGGDPFNIEWWMYFTAADGAGQSTGLYQTIMYHECGDTAATGGREWHINAYSTNATAVYFQFMLVTHQGDSTAMRIKSVLQQATVLDDAWHHYRVCRDGDYARIFIDGGDVTDLSTTMTYVKDDSDVYARNGTNYFYFGGPVRAFKSYITEVRMDSGGNVAYSDFATPGWLGYELSTRAWVTSQSRGYADGLMWQYRWPGGCFNSGSSGQSYQYEGNLFKERVETSSNDIFRYDNQSTGAGNSSGIAYGALEMYAKNNAQLIRQHELPFTYIKTNASILNWVPNNRVFGASSSHVGDFVGYSYDGTEHSLYLRNPTGTFSTGERVYQISGASATVTTSLQAHTTYEAFATQKVSPSWNHTFHKTANDLKSVTEVRAFRDIDPVNGRQLTYPHTAWLSVDVRAQKGLTAIPKVNAIVTGFSTKTLYRWDSTNEAVSAIAANMNLRNPAWAAWDLLTDGFWNNGTAYARGYSTGTYEGYGAGIHPKYLDYQSFAEWSSYCTATVNGVTRCLVNISLDEKDKTLWDALESIALVGRGRLVPMGNKWYAKVNTLVTAPAMVVGGAVIEAGSYEEEYIDDSEKYDEINIEFLNEENKYIKDTVGHATDEWDDPTDYNIMKSQTVFVKGITNPDQAKREAILRLQQVQATNKRIRFVMDIDAINFEIGDVIKVQHWSNKYTHSGICKEFGYDDVGRGYITIDHDITMESAVYSRSSSIGKIAWRQQSADTWTEMNVQGPFDQVTSLIITTALPAISVGDPVFVGRSDSAVSAPDYDLIRVEEINVLNDQKVEIIGYNYVESVYTHTDYGTTAI